MAFSQDYYQTGIFGGGWWNPGRSLFPPCSAPVSDFMWLDSSLSDMGHQADQMKQGASYSRSDDDSSDGHHYSSSSADDQQHLSVISTNYAPPTSYSRFQVTDFNGLDWSEYNLSHDSTNMDILRPVVVNDQKEYTNNNSHDFYTQEQLAVESQTVLENSNPSFEHQLIIQSLAGPDTTTDMSYAFENSFAHNNWPKMLVSTSPKQQLSTNSSVLPFWDYWISNDETDINESHQLQAPDLVEDQKPCNIGKPTREISLIQPKVGSKDIIAQKLASSGSTQLGTKRKNNTTKTDEMYKRPRFETPSSLPTFKVRKEKLGDRITALQQLVSPFGKTDTASVLQEAIEYIKFLHDQVSVLRTSYMQNGTPPTNQGESKNAGSEGPKIDLKSRGLCLVPISSTFPVANETTADLWTPAFGGTMTFR